jgi:hypothetical protein
MRRIHSIVGKQIENTSRSNNTYEVNTTGMTGGTVYSADSTPETRLVASDIIANNQ